MRPKQKITLLIVILSILFILLVGSMYLFYINLRTCTTEACFDSALIKCSRAFFIKDTTNTIIQYKIFGRSGSNCDINVKILQVIQGSSELANLEGKEMDCSIPFGVFIAPESDIESCHGLLKEEIQNLIIKRMHSQIIENLGKISAETTKVL